MDPSGADADEIRTLTERSRGALQELREGIDKAKEAREANLNRLGEEATALVSEVSSKVAEELADEFARRSEEQQAASMAEVESEREAWLAERAEWESVRDQIESELAGREAALREEADRLKAERAELESAGAATADARVEQLQSRLDEAEGQVRELTEALEQASTQLTTASEAEQEHNDLREKFEIALADLRSHREHVAELEQQLAERPEPGSSDTAELSQLRQERDELARELEAALASPPAGESSEENEDLRRRFELAVEDVRRLKTENAELRETMADAPALAVEADGNDWEAQKRKLLASLEGDEGDADPERQEERATIAGTIQITDGVIAEKDQEIERLKALIEQGGGGSGEAPPESALDHDEQVQAERERLAGVEKESQEKVRAAELELSVERAKVSRAQSELAELQIELETLRAAAGGDVGDSKGKWLNKLGLGDANK